MSLLVFLLSLLTIDDAPPAPATEATAERRSDEYHFDALRIDGHLRGPEVMVVRSKINGSTGSVLKLRRSFLKRVYETVEVPALHGGR